MHESANSKALMCRSLAINGVSPSVLAPDRLRIVCLRRSRPQPVFADRRTTGPVLPCETEGSPSTKSILLITIMRLSLMPSSIGVFVCSSSPVARTSKIKSAVFALLIARSTPINSTGSAVSRNPAVSTK